MFNVKFMYYGQMFNVCIMVNYILEIVYSLYCCYNAYIRTQWKTCILYGIEQEEKKK